MSAGTDARRRAEAFWRERLRVAENCYHIASANTRQIQAEYTGRSMPTSDGAFALQGAISLENEARLEYVRVLRLFTQLILYGEQPDENTSQAS
ncbi:MAG TPA: hypothetical protein VG096_17830 [Bryobacteraceae bacterium]|jgi:hypothetical protein|nr:hypothetical protein [Bryobacteraceae bacterium]